MLPATFSPPAAIPKSRYPGGVGTAPWVYSLCPVDCFPPTPAVPRVVTFSQVVVTVTGQLPVLPPCQMRHLSKQKKSGSLKKEKLHSSIPVGSQ